MENYLQEFPELDENMHPWEMIRAISHKLPHSEQKVIELVEKLHEIKDIMDEIHAKA
ncbi:MAG: hypothetical protein FWB80_07605 [Defluviitaleaceae bacterium]|nr:hypothetical protein [Defluviitaleaceae bacterium]